MLAFAKCVLLAAERRINQSEHAKTGTIIRLFTHLPVQFRARSEERGLSRSTITLCACREALAPGAGKIQINRCAACRHSRESLLSRGRITFAQRNIEPLRREIWPRFRIFGQYHSNDIVQWSRVGLPLEIDQSTCNPGVEVARN